LLSLDAAACCCVSVAHQSAYTRARTILTRNESELHALAGELLEKETLSGEQISGIMKQVGVAPSFGSV
jgi:ATP-dependent Zn protease